MTDINQKDKKPKMVILILDKLDFRTKNIQRIE